MSKKPVVAVGTASALKVRAVSKALDLLYPQGYELRNGETNSGMPAQPVGLEQVFQGAYNRAQAALDAHNADFGIGIENGLVMLDRLSWRVVEQWFDPPGVVIVERESEMIGRALGAFLPIPPEMVRQVREEESELGVIIQKYAGGGEKDPHKYLSGGAIDREAIITQAVLCAFCVVKDDTSLDRYFPGPV